MSNVIMCGECKMCDGDHCNYFDNDSDRESTIACILFEPKKPTNGDKIRQMSNEELVRFKEKAYCFYCAYHVEGSGRFTENCDKPQGKTCIDGFRIWLNAPAESEGEDE